MSLHNDDNEMVLCTNKRTQSASENVSDYIYTHRKLPKDNENQNPGFPGMYLQ